MAKTRRSYEGGALSTTTTSAIAASGTTSFTITAYTGWPYGADPFYVVVEPGTASEEKILVTRTGSTDTTINVASDDERGQDGTSAVSHASGSTVFPVFTAVDADEANELTSSWSAKGDLVSHGSTTFETLAVGTNDEVLTADSSTASGLAWKDTLSVASASVSGDLTVDTDTLHVDSTNGRVGIGTATPSSALEVVGTSVVDNLYSESTSNWNFSQLRATRNASNTANTKIASFLLDGDSESSSNLYDSVNFVLRTDSAPTTGSTSSALNAGLEITAPDSVRFGTGSTERVRVDDDGLNVVSGDLRIGGTAVGTWTSYTPTLTNFTVTSMDCKYCKINKIVFVNYLFNVNAVTGTPWFTTPTTIGDGDSIVGHGAFFLDQGSAWYTAQTILTGSGVGWFRPNVVGSLVTLSGVNATSPFTWATGDAIIGNLWYLEA